MLLVSKRDMDPIYKGFQRSPHRIEPLVYAKDGPTINNIGGSSHWDPQGHLEGPSRKSREPWGILGSILGRV